MSELWPAFKSYNKLSVERKELRLLHIEWVWTLEILTGHFKHASLNANPKYDALSYCWGNAGEHETILLEGQRVYLRTNVYHLLKTLCTQGQKDAVWLDCLCIDQKNIPERNAQVAMMRDIFASAQNVLSWLGPGDADCDLGLRYGKAHCSSPQDCLTSTQAGQQAGQCLLDLCLRPYWRRTWIVQECVVARKLWILCGRMRIHWDQFREAVFSLTPTRAYSASGHTANLHGSSYTTSDHLSFDMNSYATNVCRRLDSVRLAWQGGEADRLESIVNEYRDTLCQDPRDRIYAMRGICCDASHLVVNYGKSLVDVLVDAISSPIPQHFLTEAENPHQPHFAAAYKHKVVSLQSASRLLENLSITQTNIESHLGDQISDSHCTNVLREARKGHTVAVLLAQIPGRVVQNLSTRIVHCNSHYG